MPKTNILSALEKQATPNYVELLKFLMQPFLDPQDSLSIDCEQLSSKPKIWLRVAFEGTDKGKVFGRGGRNIQAIRTVLETAAAAADQNLFLDVYGSHSSSNSSRDRDLELGSRPKPERPARNNERGGRGDRVKKRF